MFEEGYRSLTKAELWQKYQDYEAGKVERAEPKTVGEWTQNSKQD